MANESIAAEVISASLSGAFSASALYPLEVLKTKMQAETGGGGGAGGAKSDGGSAGPEATESGDGDGGDEDDVWHDEPPASPGMIEYARRMHADGGVGCFYAGIETSAIQSAAEKALYFFAYTGLKNTYKGLTGAVQMGTLPNLFFGCLAEWAHLPVTLPIDCLTTKIQTDNSGAGAYALMTAMLSEKGLKGMYKGVQAYVVLCLKPAIQYTIFEQVKMVRLAGRRRSGSAEKGNEGDAGDESLGAAEAFFLGMVARTIATVVCFPYVRGKVMLQSTYAEGGAPRGGIPGMILEMFRDGGLGEVFRGIGPELTRGVLSAALMLMAKEKISAIVRNLLGSNQRRLGA